MVGAHSSLNFSHMVKAPSSTTPLLGQTDCVNAPQITTSNRSALLLSSFGVADKSDFSLNRSRGGRFENAAQPAPQTHVFVA